MKALVPGTFDPITLGHLDVVTRTAAIFDEVVVAVAESGGKAPWFTLDERCAMVGAACGGLRNVKVDTFGGLLVQYAAEQGARVVVKGLRAVSDFEYELGMAHTNRMLAPELETLFMMTQAEYSFLRSTTVRELARLGGEVRGLVPPNVVEPLLSRAAERSLER